MSRWFIRCILLAILLVGGVLTIAQEANARVNNMSGVLNVRSGPGAEFPIIGELQGRTPLIVSGKSPTLWYQVATVDSSVEGWVASGFVTLLTIAEEDIPFIFPNSVADTTTETETTEAEVETAAPAEATAEPAADIAVANAVEAEVAPLNTDAPTGTVLAAELNFRVAPDLSAGINRRLVIGTTVYLLGRDTSGAWLRVQIADGTLGWVSSNFIETETLILELPDVTVDAVPVAPAEATESAEAIDVSGATVTIADGQAPYFTLGAAAANIFAAGQELGNRPDVFSKVGDSITAEELMFTPFGFGNYNLGDYAYLQPTVDFYLAPARAGNSWNTPSLAANFGWTTNTVLNPEFADSTLCEAGESPLACEYRLNRPAVALILFGSNDVVSVPYDQYIANMNRIVDISIENGVIPVLSSLPPRPEFPTRRESYSEGVLNIARERGLPYWDFYAAISLLPNAGMNTDQLHPSSPPLGYEAAADFTGDNLLYGYVVRNLTALQALHVLRENVLQ